MGGAAGSLISAGSSGLATLTLSSCSTLARLPEWVNGGELGLAAGSGDSGGDLRCSGLGRGAGLGFSDV